MSTINKKTRLVIKRLIPFGVLSAVNSTRNRDKDK